MKIRSKSANEAYASELKISLVVPLAILTQVVMVQLLHDTIPALNKAVVGFELLGGTRLEQAKKLADLLNEYVLDVFVTVTEKGATA